MIKPELKGEGSRTLGPLNPKCARESPLLPEEGDSLSGTKPFVSILVPAYNEALVLQPNLTSLCTYMHWLEQDYDWELVIVNDGSQDDTGAIATAFAQAHPNVKVVHHAVNRGLGQAIQSGLVQCHGDCVITLDIDLSYAPEHIEQLLRKQRQTQAHIVVTSPYMKGGQVSNVPWLRRTLSVCANWFLSLASKRNISTLTGMVRAYDRDFLRGLHLRANGMDINPEVIHKAQLLGAKIEEIPAHLNWRSPSMETPQPHIRGTQRQSSMKIWRQTWATLFYGFMFRPVMFFIVPSLFCFGLSLYANSWVLIHCWNNYQKLAQIHPFPNPTEAVAHAFQQAPHTFMIGGITLMLAIQLFSLGVLAVQSKSYFEEIFYLGSAIYRNSQGDRDSNESH